MAEMEWGLVTHYFGHLGVAAVKLTGGGLAVGDILHFKGHTTDFAITVESMQLEHAAVQSAAKGDNVGLKVPDHVREHDKVYKVVP